MATKKPMIRHAKRAAAGTPPASGAPSHHRTAMPTPSANVLAQLANATSEPPASDAAPARADTNGAPSAAQAAPVSSAPAVSSPLQSAVSALQEELDHERVAHLRTRQRLQGELETLHEQLEALRGELAAARADARELEARLAHLRGHR